MMLLRRHFACSCILVRREVNTIETREYHLWPKWPKKNPCLHFWSLGDMHCPFVWKSIYLKFLWAYCPQKLQKVKICAYEKAVFGDNLKPSNTWISRTLVFFYVTAYLHVFFKHKRLGVSLACFERQLCSP